MKKFRMFKSKRVLSTLICLILITTMVVSSMPVAKALEPIRLEENVIDKDIFESGAFSLMTTNATVKEVEPAPHYLRIARGGDTLPATTLKLEMFDVSAKYGDDYTVELLGSDVKTENVGNGTSIREAMSSDDAEVYMFDENGNDLSMTEEAAKQQLEEEKQLLNEEINESMNAYVKNRAAADGIDIDALKNGSDEEDTGVATQSAISREYEAQTGLVDDRTPMKANSSSNEQLGEVLEAGYGMDAINDMANVMDVPYLTIDFAAGETEKTVVIKTIDNDKGEGNKLAMLKLVTDAERSQVAETYSMLNLTIEDDEKWEKPTVSFAADSFKPEGGYAMVTVKREGLTTMVSSVHMTSTNGTATAGRDFSEVDTDVIFPYGIKERLLKIPVGSKLLKDGGSFTLTLSAPVDCQLGKAEAEALIPKGAESYNPKTTADLAETGDAESVNSEILGNPIDLKNTIYTHTEDEDAYCKMEGNSYVIRGSSSVRYGGYKNAYAQWALKSYAYSGVQIDWEKEGNFTTISRNNLSVRNASSSTEEAGEYEDLVNNEVKNWDRRTETFYLKDFPYEDKLQIGVSEDAGWLSKDPVLKIHSVTPILRPFEVTLLDPNASELKFLGQDGKFGSAEDVGLSYAKNTKLTGGNVKRLKDDSNQITVALENSQYSYIKSLEVVKFKKDITGKVTIQDSMVVKTTQAPGGIWSAGTEQASFKLTEELLTDLSDRGFITYSKNGDKGLKGNIGVRAVLAPYDFDFEIDTDDKRGTVKVFEPENAPEGWRWHKGDYMTAQTEVYDQYKMQYYPIGVAVNDQKTSLDDTKNTIWENDTEKQYTVRQLDYAYLKLKPCMVANDNQLIVKVSNKNLKYYRQNQGFFKTAKQIKSPEPGYRYYLLYDSDEIIPNKYYELSAMPGAAGNVAGWRKDVGKITYYENTHFFQTSWRKVENVVELLAPKKADATLVMTGTAYYSGATLDRRVEGEAWMPAKGALVAVDALHYDFTGDDGKFTVKSLETKPSGEDDITMNYPLYICTDSNLTYKIECSGITKYFDTAITGEKDKDGVIHIDIGKFKVSTIDKTHPYIASLTAYDQSSVTTGSIPIVDKGLASVRVVVNNCGAAYDMVKKENTVRMELFGYHPKDAKPIKLATLDKNHKEEKQRYTPEVDGNQEVWTFRFAANNEVGLLSSDKLYVRLTTDRKMNGEVIDENGNPVESEVFSETVYPPVDTGVTFTQPPAELPEIEHYTLLENDKLLTKYIDFPIFGSMQTLSKSGNIVFKTTALPGNGMRFSFGYVPEKLSKRDKDMTGDGDDIDGDYSFFTRGFEGPKSAWEDSKDFSNVVKAHSNLNTGIGKLLPINGFHAGFMFGIYVDLGRICSAQGESFEFMGAGVFLGGVVGFKMIWYVSICGIPVYFGFNGTLDMLASIGLGAPDGALKEKPIQYFEDNKNVLDFSLDAQVMFEAYVGAGIRGVLGARGGIHVDLDFIWWPTVAKRFPDQNQLLKNNGHPDGIRTAGFHANVSFKIWLDLIVASVKFTLGTLVDKNFGFFEDRDTLAVLNKKTPAQTGASNEEIPQVDSSFQYKEAGDPSQWIASTDTGLAPTGSTYKQASDVELKKGGYDHADPQLIDIGEDKILLVYVDEDSNNKNDDRTCLRYQIYDKKKDLWLSTPGVIQAKNGETNVNGAMEPKVTDAEDKIMITWTAGLLPKGVTHEDDDYFKQYLKQRNVYSVLIDKSALRSTSADQPAQYDGELVSATDVDCFKTCVSGLYYKYDGKEYIGATYLVSDLESIDQTGLTGDDQKIAMAASTVNNSYVRGALYNTETHQWEEKFEPFKLNSTYDSKTKTWKPIEGAEDGMTTNNPVIIDLNNAIWNNQIIYSFVVDEDNNVETDEDREVFIKIENLITGDATVSQLTDDKAFTDNDGEQHLGVAKACPQLIKANDSVYLFWQHGKSDVAWCDLGKMLSDENTFNSEDGSIKDREKIKWSYIFYPTVGVDIDPSYAGFKPFVDEKGNLYVVWTQGITENGKNKQEIYAQSFITDQTEENTNHCWSDPIRLTETDSGDYFMVNNDEPAVADLGSGELMIVCNRFGFTSDSEDDKVHDLSMRGIRFETVGSVKPIDVQSQNVYPAPGEKLALDVTVKNEGLKTANGFALAMLLVEKEYYKDFKDMTVDVDLNSDDLSLLTLASFENTTLKPSESTTVHIDETNAILVNSKGELVPTTGNFVMPDKLSEEGYVVVAMAFEKAEDGYHAEYYDNAPFKAFDEAIMVDPFYTVNAIADSNRHDNGLLNSNDFSFSAVVNGDGNIPMRDSDRLVVGPANIDTGGELADNGYYLDVPISELTDVECETGTAKEYSGTFKIPEKCFTYGFTTVYTQIVDKNGKRVSPTQYIQIESEAPYYISVEDKKDDTQLADSITLKQGETITMEGSYEPSSHFRDGKVVYSVEDTSIATVDKNGVLTAVSEGSTTLYASVDIYDAVREFTVTVTRDTILGDTDGDDSVTIIDATYIQRRLADMEVDHFVEEAADADLDTKVTIIDATFIQRWLADLPTNDKIGKPIPISDEYGDSTPLVPTGLVNPIDSRQPDQTPADQWQIPSFLQPSLTTEGLRL